MQKYLFKNTIVIYEIIIFTIVISVFLYIGYIGIIDIYSYYFKYIKAEGKIIDFKIIEEKYDEGVVSKVKYYLISYKTKDDSTPGEKWIYINKKLKIGDYIVFKYDPDNPDKVSFGVINVIFFLLLFDIPMIIFFIILMKNIVGKGLIYEYMDYE